jgi:hypothetical protein
MVFSPDDDIMTFWLASWAPTPVGGGGLHLHFFTVAGKCHSYELTFFFFQINFFL